MKPWLRKIIVGLITVATLGMYTPTALLEVEAEKPNDRISKSDTDEESQHSGIPQLETGKLYSSQPYVSKEEYLYEIIKQAKEQTITKFGPRIRNHVEDEFTTSILPAMEEVIASILENAGDDYKYYQLTEEPVGGYGEKIFHVYDHKNEKDVARFHVRRVNRPLDGHYFNFHYHLTKDGFKEHHEIGEIFWAKNTPPKWMS